MKTWFHRLFLAAIFTLTFAHVHVGVSVPNGLTSAQISVSVFQTVEAATRTFIGDGASHNWSATGAWVEGIVPTAADDVVFSSNTVGSILVIDGTSGSPSLCRSIDTTNYTRTITFANAKQWNIGDGTTGAFKMTVGMTFAPGSSSLVKFASTTTGNNITTAGYTFGNLTFDGVGGAWTLQDNLTVVNGSGVTLTLTNGSLDTNGKTILNAAFSSSNSNTRSLTLGATSWTAGPSNPSGTAIWDISTPTGMTLSASSSTIISPSTTGTPTFAGGGLTYGTLTSTTQTTGALTITGANTFGTLTLSQGASPSGQYKLGANQHVTGTFTTNGNSVLNRDYITSDTKGTPRTITVDTTVTASQVDFQDIVGAGAASWNLSAITGGSGDCGGNSGITFNTPKNAYMKTAVSVNWSAAVFETTDGGSTPISPSYPLEQDTVFITANGVTASGKTITIDASALRLPAMNWTGVLNTPALAFTTAASYFGSITLVSGMTVSGTGQMTFEGRGSQTVTTAGITMTPGMTVNSPGGTWTQQDNLTNNRAGATSQFTRGTWATGSNNLTFSGSAQTITVNGGTLTSAGTLSTTGASGTGIVLSSGDINMPLGIWSGTVSGTPPTFSGGTAEIGTLTITGNALTITGTTVQIGIGGAAFATPLTISSTGSLAPTTGNKITSVSSTAIAVSAAASGGGSCSFGDAGQWRDWNEANDNAKLLYRKAI